MRLTTTEPTQPTPGERLHATGSAVRTVTIVFTDIEGSTALLQALGPAYGNVLATHHRLLRAAFSAEGGEEVDTAGDGLFYTFSSARSAVMATIAGQRAILAEPWPDGAQVRVRMGIHTGEPAVEAIGYIGIDVHRAARIAAAGHGGQILASEATGVLARNELSSDVGLVDLGEHRLRDLTRPERLFQVTAAGLISDFPSIRTLDTLPNNLPRHLTTFIGREKDIADATAALASSALVTLIGPSGVGKTRLALQIAAEQLDRFDDGVWLVELATIAEETMLVPAVAAALGVVEHPGRPLLDNVLAHLHARQLLLILDNCEHLVLAAARFCDAALRADPSLRIVATSREALGVAGERLFAVPSLSMPDARRPATAEELSRSEAAMMFAERAGLVSPGFRITARNAAAVALLVHSLDGNPLALELAAARLRALPVEQVAARLGDRFRLLTGGSRVALPRQQTLRAAIDWSYDLLSEEERAVLRRLGAFAGSFSLEAAEEICAGIGIDRSDVLDLLTRLVDKSLVIAGERDAEDQGFRLLETIREYAREHLVEAGEAAEAQDRHLEWHRALVERAKPEFFRGPEPAEWLERFDRSHDNLRAALAWATSSDDRAEAGLSLAAGLWRFWEIRGHLSEGRSWLERVLGQTRGQMTELRANALTGAGILADAQGDHKASVAFHEESLEVHRWLGSLHSVSYALNNLANSLILAGDYDRALQLQAEALAMTNATGDWRGAAIVRLHMADIVDRLDDPVRARQLFDESLPEFQAHDDPWGIAFACGSYAQIALRRGDVDEARDLVNQAIEQYRYIGDGRGVARMLTMRAEIATEELDRPAAKAAYAEGMAIRFELGDRPGLATALERYSAFIRAEDPTLAARLVGAADALRESIGSARPTATRAGHERLVEELRTELGADAYRAAWATGRLTALEDILAEAGVRTLP